MTGDLSTTSLDTSLITPELLTFYRQRHASGPYGVSARSAVGARIQEVLKNTGVRTILDYGAGNRSMERYLKEIRPDLKVTSYDPAIPDIARKPSGPFDLVMSIDCMEHIDPALIDNVLADVVSLARKRVFLHIACRAAREILTDGRNAHLIIESPDWWIEKVGKLGNITNTLSMPSRRPCDKWHAVEITLDKE